MSIEGFIGGVMMLIASASSGTVDSKTVLNSAILADKAKQKSEQGTWGASAHEEGHQLIKDFLREIR